LNLTPPPEPLARRQRTIVIVLAVVCAATRFLAMAGSLWDWDEALFTLAMRGFDVTKHHPHPPGFPVFIGLGHLFRLVTPSDFRALQAMSLLAGMALFPAVFFLGRELRLRFETSLVAALLCAFFPNVLYFGGTAFSDVPSIVLVVVAVACLLRGCRSAEAYLMGSFLLALAIGIRPQNFLVGLAPGLIATWYRIRRSWRDVVFAALIGIVIVGTVFGAAIVLSGSWEKYMSAVRYHGEYITRVDSFHSPDRPSLWRLFPRFFLQQYGWPPLSFIVSALAVVSAFGAVRNRDRSILINVLTFAPMAILAWLMLDRFSISRFSIGYIPMFALLAADGIDRVMRRWPRFELAAGGALALAFFLWTLPALNEVRSSVSPSIAGATEAARRIDSARDRLFVDFHVTPFIEVVAPGMKYTRLYDERGLPLSPQLDHRRPWLLAEIDSTTPHGYVAHRERGHLWNIARRHFFDVAFESIDALPQFTEGWNPSQSSGTDETRWCGSRGVILLPPVTGEALLRLEFMVRSEMVPEHPMVTVMLNGTIVEQFASGEETTVKEWRVIPAPNGAPNTLVLSIDKVYNAVKRHTGDDPRDLGIGLHFLSFGVADR
jgi:Dolichyl-phosphate-mannose-protein mannosyltransferase